MAPDDIMRRAPKAFRVREDVAGGLPDEVVAAVERFEEGAEEP